MRETPQLTNILLALASTVALVLAAVIAIPARAGGDDLSEAQQQYAKLCASCHAKDGSGDTATGKKLKVKPFSHPDVKAMTDEELYRVTAEGEGKMPGYQKKLNEKQLRDQVRLVRVLGKH